MGFIVPALLLLAMLRLLVWTRKPLRTAAIYAGISFVLGMVGLAFEPGFPELLLWTALEFGYAWLWFWVLVEKCHSSREWWLVVVAGLVVPALIALIVDSFTGARPAA